MNIIDEKNILENKKNKIVKSQSFERSPLIPLFEKIVKDVDYILIDSDLTESSNLSYKNMKSVYLEIDSYLSEQTIIKLSRYLNEYYSLYTKLDLSNVDFHFQIKYKHTEIGTYIRIDMIKD